MHNNFIKLKLKMFNFLKYMILSYLILSDYKEFIIVNLTNI